jgi:RND family efflux transporter MFP subunit
MRLFLMLIASGGILAAAYTVTFGMPAPIKALVASYGTPAPAETEAAPRTDRPRGPGGQAGGRATMVVTAPLEATPYTSILHAIGTASALRSVDVVSNAAGVVVAANLPANGLVTEGDVLLRLDSRAQTLSLQIAQAERDQRRETVQRYETLRTRGNSTVTDVTLSEARLAQRLAEAEVGLRELALEDRTITAKLSGRLSLSDVNVGDMISTNQVIASIDQSDSLLIEFELPERSIRLLEGAKTVDVSTSTFAGRVFTAQILSYDSRIDDVTRSVTVKARIENTDGSLWPGMTFSVRLTQESAALPSVPSTAITWTRAGASIWVAAEGVANRVPVTILFRQDETVWIDADLPAEALIVTEGAQKLRPGARITTPDSPQREGAPANRSAEGEPRTPREGATAGKDPA